MSIINISIKKDKRAKSSISIGIQIWQQMEHNKMNMKRYLPFADFAG